MQMDFIFEHCMALPILSKMGPTVSFNLKREDGSWFGYRKVEKLASLSNIQLRTGWFCNPGACSKFLGLTHSDLLSNIESGHVCWDDHDILNGKPTGAVRVSFGYMSTYQDAERFLRFIENSFVLQPAEPVVPKPICPLIAGNVRDNKRCYVKSITVYPIKSCAGFNVERWPLNSTGLLHDREWLLKSLTGEVLTQKKVPEMAFLTTSIDLNLGLLCVNSPRSKETLQIDLKSIPHNNETQVMKIYSQRYEVQGYQSEVDEWFNNAIGRPCKLVRSFGSQNHICSDKTNGICRDLDTKLNFVNEAQFLLISEESVVDVNSRLKSKLEKGLLQHPLEVDPTRFRPNLVFSGGTPYVEDEWRSVKIGDTHFKSLGGCNRCQMINLSPKIGSGIRRSNEPLATLASYRRVKGKICFGILLRLCDSIIMKQDSHLAVGEQVIGSEE